MKDQHTLITGYRELSQEEVDLMNEVKALGEYTRAVISKVEWYLHEQDQKPVPEGDAPHSVVTSPLRWLAEGRTDLQKGLMCVTRAIAQPTTF
jgi:hypothetical protein